MSKGIVACIGSRETPPAILKLMERMGAELVRRGFIIRSGNAKGADQAFARGANTVDPSKVELFLPNQGYEQQAIHPNNRITFGLGEWAYAMAATYHPAWERCNDVTRHLHARNSAIIMGADGQAPATRVVCWTKDASAQGGTGQGIRIARAKQVPVHDMGDRTMERKVCQAMGLKPTTRVLNVHKLADGWQKDPNCVFIMRRRDLKWGDHVFLPSQGRFGNPFVIGKDGDRADVINQFKAWLPKWLADLYTVDPKIRDREVEAIRNLQGKDLVCCCAPQACHGDVLAYVASE